MEKISVSIRVRPLDKQEAARGSSWKISKKSIALCNSNGAPLPNQLFTFDNVFDADSTTGDVYASTTRDIVVSAVKGFNGTVFAYGQTSSGKTYTMRGTSDEMGIIPLAIHDIFNNLEKANDREFLLRMSYMEIYNEEINDLLAPEQKKLQIHESLERGIFVWGLREEIVACPEQVLQLMEFGEAHRHVGETNMNLYSSRSHTIFRMVIESRDRTEDDPSGLSSCDAVRVSVLNLVDLAGSERVAKTGAEGTRLKEGTHINKSLMTLGTVINKLSEGIENQGGHVPYRDSKLTRILQPALGGNARTAIICNITPAMVHIDESRGTLQFASRAMRVTNCAQVNEILTDAALLKRQKKEIEELRCRLKESHSEHLEGEILSLRNTLLKSENERERIALELQKEKKAHAERERQQAQKIENLSSLVLSSSVDDYCVEKRTKKIARRETWCPLLPSSGLDDDLSYHVKDYEKNRDRAFPLPPPFECLVEGSGPDISRDNELALDDKNEDNDSAGALPDREARIHVADRKRKYAQAVPTLSKSTDEFLEVTRARDTSCYKKTIHQVLEQDQVSEDLSKCRDKLCEALVEIERLKNLNAELTLSLAKAEESCKLLQEQPSGMSCLLEAAPLEAASVCKEHEKILGDFCDDALKNVIKDLKREKEELALQLTDAYLQFEEEKAAWLSIAGNSLDRKGGNMKVYHASSETGNEENTKETTTRLELAIREKDQALNQMAVVLRQLDEAQSEIERQHQEHKKMHANIKRLQETLSQVEHGNEEERNLRVSQSLELVALNEKITVMERKIKEEKDNRELQSRYARELELKLSSLEDLLKCSKKDHLQEKWQLRTECLKLQVALDAVSAKSEVFHGRWLEAKDELRELQGEVDRLRALQTNLGQEQGDIDASRTASLIGRGDLELDLPQMRRPTLTGARSGKVVETHGGNQSSAGVVPTAKSDGHEQKASEKSGDLQSHNVWQLAITKHSTKAPDALQIRACKRDGVGDMKMGSDTAHTVALTRVSARLPFLKSLNGNALTSQRQHINNTCDIPGLLNPRLIKHLKTKPPKGFKGSIIPCSSRPSELYDKENR